MNFENSTVGNVMNLEGEVFVRRDGIEVPLRPEMTLLPGDSIRTTQNSLAVVSIPGSQGQIPVFMEVSSGAEVGLGFDPDLGKDGQVVVSRLGDDAGNVVLVSEFDGENQAAVMEGQEGSESAMTGLFGAGLLGGSLLTPVAGAVGAAALFAGLSGEDEETAVGGSNSGGGVNSGDNNSGGTPTGPADQAGGLAQTVSSLTNNLSELTSPVPVVSDVVNTVGKTLESVLVGDNNGGVTGILEGLADGLGAGLDGTPLEPVGNAIQMGLDALTSALGSAGGQVSSLGEGTPLEPLADLVGSLLGAPGPNVNDSVGGVVGTLVNVTDNVAQLLEPVPLLGELTGTLGSAVESIATGNNEGGISSVLTGLGDGLETGLSSTPLAVLGEGANTLLDTVGGGLGGLGDAISSVGGETPASPVTNLVGDLLGSLEGDVNSPLAEVPLLGGVLDSLTGGLDIGSGSLDGIPLLGDLLGGGLLGGAEGGLLGGAPLVGDLLGALSPSQGTPINSASGSDGGLLSGLPLLGDLTRSLG